ncbi:hypothetical protein CPC197_1361, partial [Chlamydia psittaci C1/97]
MCTPLSEHSPECALLLV